jgi:hypothetical protein
MSSRDVAYDAFLKLIATPELPLLGPQRRVETKSVDELTAALGPFFAAHKISSSEQALLRSAALLWHDHLDASHAISQGIDTRDGSWLHGIMHRREPDYGNAKYWFRRVGQHDAFPSLAERVSNEPLSTKLIKNGEWMPFAFVDECERAESRADATLRAQLQRVQEIEFQTLVEHIFNS